jgi:hypothetical protein
MPDPKLLRKMTSPRTALYQPFTAGIDEGWTRFVLEQFEFPFSTVHNAEIRAGNLRERFDCIVLPDQRLRSLLDGVSDKDMPPPYAGGIGEEGAMALERYVQDGGTLVLMGSATELGTELLRLPVRNVLDALPREEFFCPGSLLRVRVDNTHPLGYGLPDEVAAYFNRSKAFAIGKAALKHESRKSGVASAGHSDRSEPYAGPYGSASAAKLPAKVNEGDACSPTKLTEEEIAAKLKAQPVVPVATYSDNIILLSGWLLGERHLRNRTAVCEVSYGKGHIVLLGFRVQHRAQSHGTFKLLFNSIYRSTLQEPEGGS